MNVLCVMAHPDDEVLGCGGTLAKHAEQGDTVTAVIACFREMRDEISAAAEVLGIKTHTWGFPDQQLETLPLSNLVAIPEESDRYHGPADIIYTHHPGDLNLDHALTARAVLTAFRPKPHEKPRRIMACEVLSSTEYTYPRVFQPNWYEALTPEQTFKAEDALAAYESEMQSWPHPRSIGGLENRWRTRGSEVGVQNAEAFQLLRAGPF